MARTFFITGSDTGVGKTVLAALLVARLRSHGGRVGAAKPICSGGRGDAEILRAVLGGEDGLDDINPWYFREPLAPAVAARREGRRVRLKEVVGWLRRIRRGCDDLVIEGAGGLFSPLGEDFDSRDLLLALRALPVIVVADRLGAVNQALLVLAALPPASRRHARIVLMASREEDASRTTNATAIAERTGARPGRVVQLPWLGRRPDIPAAVRRRGVTEVLDGLLRG